MGGEVKPAYECNFAKVYATDALSGATMLEPQSVHTIVTSPPYWGLRSYLDKDDPGKAMELGAERTPEEYVQRLVEVFRALRPALHDTGQLWLNLGDSYATGGTGGQSSSSTLRGNGHGGGKPLSRQLQRLNEDTQARRALPGMKPKDLVGIPWMVAFALRSDGWYLRSDIVWSKPNPLPESVRDRPTKSHEYLFLLTKSPRYYFDQEAVREPGSENIPWAASTNGGTKARLIRGDGNPEGLGKPAEAAGRNIRSVWSIATQPYSGSHYATFPPALIYPCIKAGTSERGVCEACGSPWKRVVERERVWTAKDVGTTNKDAHLAPQSMARNGDSRAGNVGSRTVGWQPTCSCSADTIPATVLDPFCGSGTTMLAARKLGRRSIGLDLDQRNIALIEERMGTQGVML